MRQNIKNRLSKIILGIIIFSVFSVFGNPTPVKAATLGMSPGNISVRSGQTFTVNVSISSSDQAANAVSGNISFPSNIVEVVSISRAGSIITIWAEEPSFSNSSGTVIFEGVVLNPGFTGSSGRVVSLNMRAKTAGSGAIRFTSSAILANDGRGTNILTGAGISQVSVADATTNPQEQQESSEPTSVPAAVTISSATHPDQAKWYRAKDVSFFWTNPSNITGVNILADQVPDTDPGTVSDGRFSTYSYTDVKDGVWYFHLKVRNVRGWGPTSHFRFNIDSQPPSELTIRQRHDESLGVPRFSIFASDEGSGISRLEIILDGNTAVSHEYSPDFIYTTEKLTPGNHILNVKAFDQAGNEISRELSFVIPPYEELPSEVRGHSFPEIDVSQRIIFNQLWVWVILALFIILLLGLKFMPVGWFAWISAFSGHGRINHQIYREMTNLQMNLVNQIAMLEAAKLKRKLTREEGRVLSAIKDMLLEVDEMLINYVKQSKSGRK